MGEKAGIIRPFIAKAVNHQGRGFIVKARRSLRPEVEGDLHTDTRAHGSHCPGKSPGDGAMNMATGKSLDMGMPSNN